MQRIGKLLLAAAIGVSLPAMAMAQRGPDDRDRGGHQDRGPDQQRPQQQRQRPPQQQQGPRGFSGDRGPGGYPGARPDQQQRGPQDWQRNRQDPQRAIQEPDRTGRPDRPEGFNRDGGPNRFGAGNPQPGGYDRRDDGRRYDGRPGGDNRGDYRPGFNGRPGPGFDGRRPDDRRWDNGRPGNDRWVGSNWRQDRRYDWRGYRNYNRNQFHIGGYVAPRGWGYGYRRYSVGAVLPSLLWGSGFWLDDPYAYRLPPAYGPYRWVRYYDDVLLIDTRTGRVIDAIPGFFW